MRLIVERMTENRTKAVFDSTATTYDRDRALLIPGYESFYRWAIDLIPAQAKRILDLGAGSGLLTALIRQRFPQAQIHLIDFSGPMLDLARARLAGDANITYQQADYVTDPLPQNLCAVVSSLSIHHLEDADKHTLFARVYRALRPGGQNSTTNCHSERSEESPHFVRGATISAIPENATVCDDGTLTSGGVFINADQFAGPTPTLDARYKSLWLEQVRSAGATEQQIADSLYRQQEDRCASVEAQLAWLRAAGFADADCWYKEGRMAVLAGTRS